MWLSNTHFETPSGLDGDEHYTTAYDLAMLAKVCMENPLFYEAASSKSATLEYGNPPYRRTLTNHNKLLKTYDGAVGVKTGFTKKSGRCLVSCAERDGKRIIAVTLKDPDDWRDHTNLLDYGFSQVKTVEISPSEKEYEIPVVSAGSESLKVNVDDFSVNTLDDKGFSYEINLPAFVYAPIKKGEVIGNITYYKNDVMIESREIKATESVESKVPEKDFWDSACENFKYIFLKIWEI